MSAGLRRILWPIGMTRRQKWLRGGLYVVIGFFILGAIGGEREPKDDAATEEESYTDEPVTSAPPPSKPRKWTLKDAHIGMLESEFIARCKEQGIRYKKVIGHTTQGIGTGSLYLAGQNWLGQGGKQYHFTNGTLFSIGEANF